MKEGTKTPQNAMTSEEVVIYAYKRFLKNKDVIIPGLKNQITRLFPIKLKMSFIAKMKQEFK